MRPTSGISGSSVISAALTGRWTQVGCQPAPATPSTPCTIPCLKTNVQLTDTILLLQAKRMT